MYPFRSVLFPTDFTPHARAALKYAAAFAREDAGRVVILSVQEGSVPANLLTLPDRVFDEPGQDWYRDLRARVKELLADPLLEGLKVTTEIVEGEPASEITRAIHEHGIDLVTVVTHGRTGLAHALWGSTAEEIITGASCPVLTIRPPQRDFVEHRSSQTEINLNRVLLATNFRTGAETAARLASEIARRAGAEFHALYVIGDLMIQIAELFPDTGGHARQQLRQYVEENMRALSREAGTEAVAHISEGRPYEEILRLASERDIDLVVLGTVTHTSILSGAPTLGPEIERVVRNAPCPVLCVPTTRPVTPMPLLVGEPVPQM